MFALHCIYWSIHLRITHIATELKYKYNLILEYRHTHTHEYKFIYKYIFMYVGKDKTYLKEG